jgi:hypothetical protein
LAFLATTIYYSISRQLDSEKVIDGYLTGFLIATGAGLIGGVLTDSIEIFLDKRICRIYQWEYDDYLFSKSTKEKNKLRKEQLKRMFGI